ncbi:glycoside hydrolase superfamily [Umbelopsis sp. PMI_123]|nr:glycoside hydrolase superfamily [Umbelopsis sp. PMI_123]
MSKNELGELLVCGFDGLQPTEGILDLIRNHGLGSIILFSRNIDTPEQVLKMTTELQQAAKDAGHTRPLLIAADQENGVVRRLGSAGTYLPGNMALGAIRSREDAKKVAVATSSELLALGINWNLAPSLDVNNNALNPVIGVRSYGEDPELVGRLGAAQVQGYQESKVATSVKHFPGHGDTATDSHLGVPVIDKSLEDLEKVELIPFRRVIASSDPASVMVAHMSLPQIIKKIDGDHQLVSSICREVPYDLLRKRIGYQGVIVTDCLEMDAVKDTFGTPEGAVLALKGGHDMAMISHTLDFQRRAFDLVLKAYESAELNAEEIKASIARVAALKDKYISWESVFPSDSGLKVVGDPQHLQLRDELYDKVPTIVRDRGNVLPLALPKTDKVLFLAAHVPVTLAIDSEPNPFSSFYQSIVKRHQNTIDITFYEDQHTDSEIEKAISDAAVILIGTANANLHHFQAAMVKRAIASGKPVIVTAVINPYDLMVFPELDTYLVTYEYTPPAHEAAVKVIFGEIQATSKLPVSIPGIGSDGNVYQYEKTWTVEPYDEVRDFHQVKSLWDTCLPDWPLSAEKFGFVLSNGPSPVNYVIRLETDRVIGFASTFATTEKNTVTGHLALILVSPEYRHQGVGTLLHETGMRRLRSLPNIQSIQLGAVYPRFFCGIPENLGQDTLNFFKNRGWIMSKEPVWDLIQDLTDYETDNAISDRMKKENIHFSRITPSRLWELYAFQERYFSFWLSTYQHHAELGDFPDLIIAREGGDHGQVIASLVLYTANGSHPRRSDVPWSDSSLYGPDCGGMSCVGVADEQRGRGIGLGIVAYANEVLKQRGVKNSYVDWVEAVGFYKRTGYSVWRGYYMSSRQV